MAKQEEGGMTVREAGRKGGETTSERYGHEFYEEIGKKGGERGGPRPRADRERQAPGEVGERPRGMRMLSPTSRVVLSMQRMSAVAPAGRPRSMGFRLASAP